MAMLTEARASWGFVLLSCLLLFTQLPEVAGSRLTSRADSPARERTSLNAGWRFQRWTSSPDSVTYDKLKKWILPSANDFISNPSKQYTRPSNEPDTVTYAQPGFDDSKWETLDLPHDWAVKGPFYTEAKPPVGGGMGRLPVQGVGWYRRTLRTGDADKGKTVYLDIDGAMSYAMVWLNGKFVGGWPYGYASFRLDLTPYLVTGDNQLAIRLDNALDNSRFYPGAGIYRNVWLTKVAPVHVGQSGTWITTKQVSADSATLNLAVQLKSTAPSGKTDVSVSTDVYIYDADSDKVGAKVAQFPNATSSIDAGKRQSINSTVTLPKPRLWGPKPAQQPNLYVAVTSVLSSGQLLDTYETRFGVRSVEYAPDGLKVNGQRVYMQGVNQHHDLGALGAAFSIPAVERQLAVLQAAGVNALRTSHNPPAPELLDLADRMGVLVLDEIFDTWRSAKVRNDFHLIFEDWREADLRSFVRRDRNHASVVIWSFGNEVAEQGQGASGAATAQELKDIVREEDPGRQTVLGMNNAKPDSPITGVVDLIGLNYQGEGHGDGAATFPSYRSKFPNKMILSTESSSGISSRGTYLFPVTGASSATAKDGSGQDDKSLAVSAYDLYAVSWGSSPEKVFAAQDRYPYVAGEYVWTGWDYIGEPTPYDSKGARSSYFGFVDLAGFPKDRYFLYQSRWAPDVRTAHLLPHWNWPDRVGQVTPVHAFSSGDEAELFLNGKSLGRKKKGALTYRFRWDDVKYQAGELRLVTYKNGAAWANATVRTTGEAKALRLSTYKDRTGIRAGTDDLVFVSVDVVDERGDVVPLAGNEIAFSVAAGQGEIVATDNGDPRDMVAFPSRTRRAFNGHALVIVRARAGASGPITVAAAAAGLKGAEVTLKLE